MVELKCRITNKPENLGNVTRITSSIKKVPVTAIRKRGNFYIARVHEPEKNAPHNTTYCGVVYAGFLKKDNSHVELPVLKDGEEAEV